MAQQIEPSAQGGTTTVGTYSKIPLEPPIGMEMTARFQLRNIREYG